MKRWFGVREIIRHIGVKSVLSSVLVFTLTIAATCVGGYQLYRYTKESLLLQGEVNATKAAKEFDNYLIVRKNVVNLAGHVVDAMLREEQPISKVLEYLTKESLSIRESTDKESTGLYGWINGQYCDGDGWVPGKDFVPTERPWYTETIADDSDITFVKPYMDAQYDRIMTSMAMQLSNKKNVIAIDVSLERIQELTEEIARKTPGSYGVVLDKSGQVIAHSDRKELGRNYRGEKGTFGAALADVVYHSDKKHSEFTYKGRIYVVYAESIEGGWKSISVVDTQMFYRPLQAILGILILLTILEAFLFVMILVNLSNKNLAIAIQNGQIAAVADMYLSIYDIQIPTDSIREIRREKNGDTAHIIGENFQGAQSALQDVLAKEVNEISGPIMELFLDLSTLGDRLEHTETVTEEYLDADMRWCRGRFIVEERGRDGRATRVLWMIESIDAEKKHRDNLKHLSEMDQMTGLYNRVTGEGKISKLLTQGVGGMLVMMDVDKFKSINDGYGHDVGDEVIIAIANAIKTAFRSNDVVMRLGGDEFVAFAPEIRSEEDGRSLLERLLQNVRNMKVEVLEDHPVCISVGAVICRQEEHASFVELYKQADACTYESKKRPGNAYTFYDWEERE